MVVPALSSALELQTALQLLAQAGRELPADAKPGSVEWMQALIDALCELSSRDVLTGLANRRQFESTLACEVDRVARSGESALVLMADIDRFKYINDTHGHAAGDRVVQLVAQAIRECVRPMDTVARFGGDEFVVVLPSCPPAFGHVVAERIRVKVEQQMVVLPSGVELRTTLSIGGAFAPPWVRSSPLIWVERADRQLYRAKSEGRNRACLEHAEVYQVSAEEKSMLFGLQASQDLE
jgi:diguanylate cyclase